MRCTLKKRRPRGLIDWEGGRWDAVLALAPLFGHICVLERISGNRCILETQQARCQGLLTELRSALEPRGFPQWHLLRK